MSGQANIEEQHRTLEHALSERMVNHALTILRDWDRQLGGGLYSDRIQALEQNYRSLFQYYLSADDPDRDAIHDSLTTDTYRLMDEMYGDMRLQRGLAREIVSFDPERPESVVNYFSNCVHLREEDYEWWSDLMADESRSGMALLAITAINHNLRDQFCEASLRSMIDALDTDNGLVQSQLMVFTLLALIQWDIRIDFFPALQDAFVEKIGDGEFAFSAMCSLIKAPHALTATDINTIDWEGDEATLMENLKQMSKQMPKDEEEYLEEITLMLPDTWIFSLLVGDDETRQGHVAQVYLETGNMMLMWDRMDDAEEWLLERLRSDEATPRDYMNYGHCCFVRGDRLMAYENYREARRLCSSLRQFYDIFRPDRRMLVEKGIPLEQVYMMEDQLLKA